MTQHANGSNRYSRAFKAAAREQARVLERALTMIIDDEDRQRRDVVLLALSTFRDRLQMRGVTVAPQEVLNVLEEVTGTPTRGARLQRMLIDAQRRHENRRKINAREVLSEATIAVENAVKDETTK